MVAIQPCFLGDHAERWSTIIVTDWLDCKMIKGDSVKEIQKHISNSKDRKKLASVSCFNCLCIRGVHHSQESWTAHSCQRNLLLVFQCVFSTILWIFPFFSQSAPLLFWSFSGKRSLQRAGLHMARFTFHWMTNCI